MNYLKKFTFSVTITAIFPLVTLKNLATTRVLAVFNTVKLFSLSEIRKVALYNPYIYICFFKVIKKPITKITIVIINNTLTIGMTEFLKSY